MKLSHLLPRFQDSDAGLKVLEQHENWTRNQIQSYQLQCINAAWRHANCHVPFCRALFADKRIPASFTSLEEYSELMPILSKETVRRNSHMLLSQRPKPGRWISTSGATGTPAQVYWENERYIDVTRSHVRFLDNWGIDLMDRTAVLWGQNDPMSGFAGYLARLRRPVEDYLRNRLRLSAYHLDPKDLSNYLDRIEKYQPALLYGYSSAAYLLAVEALRRARRMWSLKAVVVTNEPLHPQMARTIEEAFNVPCVREYSATEAGMIAGDDDDRNCRVREDMVMVETIPADHGNYRIVVTVLNNQSFPLFRYDIGDLTDNKLQEPPIGFATIGRVMGHANDFVVAKTGRLVHPEGLSHVVKHSPEISRFHAHQSNRGDVTVTVACAQGANLQTKPLTDRLQRLLEGQHVKVVIEDAASASACTYRWITSDLSQSCMN